MAGSLFRHAAIQHLSSCLFFIVTATLIGDIIGSEREPWFDPILYSSG